MGRSLSYLKPGQKLGKYEIKQLIGRGGMAEVYRALNPSLNQDVAIKVLHPQVTETAGAVARFKREAQSIAGLIHPNIIRVYDFDSIDGMNYMVMELIDGPSLRDVLVSSPNGMDSERALTMFTRILEAVAYAHEHGVVHRDIKPGNVLVASGNRPVLTDFGLALIEGGEKLTQTGTGAGTPAYMSPEQISGEPIGPESDVYSLGILFYEMVTGNVPFHADSMPQLILKHLQEIPRPPIELVPKIDPLINYVILRALAKAPEDRFASAGEMLKTLSRPNKTVSQDELATVTFAPVSSELFSSVTSDGRRTRSIGATQRLDLDSGLVRTAPLTQTIKTIQRNPVLAAGSVIALILVVGVLAIVGAIQSSRGNTTASPTAAPLAPAGMVYVPGGTFTMGSAQGTALEKPPHAVTVKPVFMNKTEVTNKDYLSFVLDTARAQPITWPKVDRGSWVITASDGYAIGSPGQQFSYDGSVKLPIKGTVRLDLNPDTDKGIVTVEFDAELNFRGTQKRSGHWRFVHDKFVDAQGFYQGGIAENVKMHGDSGQEASVYPTLMGAVTTWGTGTVFVDDQQIASDVNFHVMYTDGVRNPQQQILKSATDCCYSPADPAKGYVDSSKKEIIILISSVDPYANGKNARPPLFVELTFTDPKVERRPSGGAVAFPPGTANHPVTGVTWEEAAAYCEYKKQRLPSEAEWEHAARGPANFLYPWGDNQKIGDKIPTNWTSNALADVGSFPDGASGYGLLDMAGNAWEWVHDWYGPDYYASSTGATDPPGPERGNERILRGGGYVQRDPAGGTEYRATFRLPFNPTETDPAFGFRCVQDIQ